MKLGAARSKAPCAWRLVKTEVDKTGALTYALDRDKLRKIRRREGRYLLRTNMTDDDPAKLWQYYIQLVAVEEAFRNLKGDLAIRPVSIMREAHRSPHLRRLPRLLPADHPDPPPAQPRPGSHRA